MHFLTVKRWIWLYKISRSMTLLLRGYLFLNDRFRAGALRLVHIGKIVTYRAQREGGEHVEHGVLLHKDGRNADEKRRDAGGDAPAPCGEDRRVPEGEERRQRADDVQRGTDVRVRIEHVEASDKACEHVVTREDLGPQHLAGGEEKVDEKGRRVGDHHEMHHAAKARYVEKERVGDRTDKVDEPE